MKVRSLVAAASLGFVFPLMVGSAAESAEVKVLAANGIQAVVEDLGPKFERASGHRLFVTFSTGGATVKRVQDGEAADVVIAPRPGIDDLVNRGKAAREEVTEVAVTGISIAIRKGASRPDISSPEALKRTLLAAKSITYLNPAEGGASGIHFARVLERLGIAHEMRSKTIFARTTGAVGASVAKGEAEFGVLQYQLLFMIPGIDVAGPLPGDLQDATVFSGAIVAGSRNYAASRALLDFLRTPEAVAVIKEKGMEAPTP